MSEVVSVAAAVMLSVGVLAAVLYGMALVSATGPDPILIPAHG